METVKGEHEGMKNKKFIRKEFYKIVKRGLLC